MFTTNMQHAANVLFSKFFTVATAGFIGQIHFDTQQTASKQSQHGLSYMTQSNGMSDGISALSK